jgi:hypothetical protein
VGWVINPKVGAGGGEGTVLMIAEFGTVDGDTQPSALVTVNLKLPGGKPVKV